MLAAIPELQNQPRLGLSTFVAVWKPAAGVSKPAQFVLCPRADVATLPPRQALPRFDLQRASLGRALCDRRNFAVIRSFSHPCRPDGASASVRARVVRGSVRWSAVLAVVAATGCGVASYQNNSTGVQLFEQGNYDGAARRFQQAIADDPAFADGYYNLASTHHRLWKLRGTPNDAAQAEQLYRLSIDRDAEHREAYRGLATLMNEQGRSQEAFTLIDTWASRSTKPAEARVELAKLYQEYNDYASAQARLREAIEIDPRNARAFAELAQLQERIGDPTQALTNYTRSYDLNRAQPEVEQRIASLRSLQGASIFSPATTPTTRTASTPPALPRY
ncbi:MAG: hypothetical protein DCC68_21565 [Planctomycetota bacterium]|nr:MAG: hypothetical protein DCC68_21565 [Planctomycetota bacterium]